MPGFGTLRDGRSCSGVRNEPSQLHRTGTGRKIHPGRERSAALKRVPGMESTPPLRPPDELTHLRATPVDEQPDVPFEQFYRDHVDRIHRTLALAVGDAAVARATPPHTADLANVRRRPLPGAPAVTSIRTSRPPAGGRSTPCRSWPGA